MFGATRFGQRLGRPVFGMAATLLLGFSIAACTAASASGSPTAIGTAGATAQATAGATDAPDATTQPYVLATASWDPARGIWTPPPGDPATPEPDESYPPDPTGTPTPPLPKGPLPSVGPVPAGTWTGINWIALPGGHYPQVPALSEYGESNASITSWSKGYVEFIWNPAKLTLTPWASADGLTWHSGPRLNTSVFALGPDDRGYCEFWLGGTAEGPSSILIRGVAFCFGGCGGPVITDEGMWVSSDGFAWTAVDETRAFPGGEVGTITGGSGGYVALGSANKHQILLTSTDGIAWRQSALPTELLATTSDAQDVVPFNGGYVVGGTVLARTGTPPDQTHYGGCASGGGDDPIRQPVYLPAAWWSPDGNSWTRDDLPGAASQAIVSLSFTQLDDHALIADETTYRSDWTDGPSRTWISTDGRTWTAHAPIPGSIMRSGGHTLICSANAADAPRAYSFSVFDSSYNLVPISQTGPEPWIDASQMVFGPTGLLVTKDGSRFWLGVPTAG
jgi:hypothetical protein